MSNRQLLLIILVIIISIVASSCVYYNTFFLAKKYYNKGEDLREDAEEEGKTSSEATKYYDKSIEKSSKVLKYYPESDHVDDALYLIGMAYFREGRYLESIQKFTELLLSFPESEFAEDAAYYRAKAELESGEYSRALQSLENLKNTATYKEEADFLYAELEYEKKNYHKALNLYLDFINAYPKSARVGLAYYRIGLIHYESERYAMAVEAFGKIKSGQIEEYQYFSVQLVIAECLYKTGEFDKAIDHLMALKDDTRNRERLGEIDLYLGDVYRATGDTATARDTWEDITREFAGMELAGRAYFKLGDMFQIDYGNYVKAKEMFDLAVKHARGTEIANLALKRSASIAKLDKYKALLADSTASMHLQFQLGEMYIFELNQPDSAIKQFEYITRKASEDKWAAKALYSLGWIYENKKSDINKANEYYANLLQEYPNTDFSIGAVEYFKEKGAGLDSLNVNTPKYNFVKAEEFLFTYQWYDSALIYYDRVIELFPESYLVPKAYLAKAYIYENKLNQPHRAKSVYRKLAEGSDGDEITQYARVRLGEDQPITEEVRDEGDLVEEVSEDTSSILLDDELRDELPQSEMPRRIPNAPPPLHKGKLIYPEAEFTSKLENKNIPLKILINQFGEVEEVELMRATTNEVIDSALVQAAKRTEFDPIKLESRPTWYYYNIKIIRPDPFEFEEED